MVNKRRAKSKPAPKVRRDYSASSKKAWRTRRRMKKAREKGVIKENKVPIPVRGIGVVYDLSVLTVGDLLRELKARGFHGEVVYVGQTI